MLGSWAGRQAGKGVRLCATETYPVVGSGLMIPVIAYLDGGSISLLVAAIASGIAGIGVYSRATWRRIRRRIRRDPLS